MLNYVNNAYDKVLKPCDAQRFSIIINSQETEKHILGHRGGDAKAKSKLPALTYMGVLDSEKYRKYLDQCKKQGTKPLGSRRAEFMRPTGLLMLDFDHVGASPDPSQGGVTMTTRIDSPVKLWEYIVSEYRERGAELSDDVALAHITPSGDGLRVVVKRVKGFTIERSQQEWCDYMNLSAIDIEPDPACKDISRLSFAPMQKEILYFNPSLLFGELPPQEDYPDGTLWGGVDTDPLRSATPCSAALVPLKEGQCFSDSHFAGNSAMEQTKEHCPSETGGRAQCSVNGTERRGYDVSAPFPTDYNGVEYSEIISRLEEQLGGRPERGARNSFIFTMACNLRYICNDDAAWIASILPTYGEDPQKHRMTIQSAINRPMSRNIPETMARALRIEQEERRISTTAETNTPPTLPVLLPEPIALLTSRTPDKMKPAVAMAVFPPLGAHVHDVKFRYWDNREYEPTFMNVLVAELSSGKSAVNQPIEYIIADMEARDDVARAKDNEWKAKCASISNTKDRPERPKGLAMQVLSSDMTNAAFVQRLADAEGKFLYTQMDEIELLNALKTNTQGNTVSAILRLAFDCGKYGQERVASNAVNAKVRVRWNWNASSTIQRVRKFLAKNIADGTLSRLSFSTIIKEEADYGRERPKYLSYGNAFADELRPYIDALCNINGNIVCPEAEAWAETLCDELADFAEELEDEAYAQLSFRAVLMGFFRAMLLYVMNDCKWTSVIGNFAAWSVKYDLWCKMRFFGDMLHKDFEGEKLSVQRGPVSLLTLLPREFTKQQVQELRIANGMKPNPSEMLRQWVQRGHVVKDETRNVYMKRTEA